MRSVPDSLPISETVRPATGPKKRKTVCLRLVLARQSTKNAPLACDSRAPAGPPCRGSARDPAPHQTRPVISAGDRPASLNDVRKGIVVGLLFPHGRMHALQVAGVGQLMFSQQLGQLGWRAPRQARTIVNSACMCATEERSPLAQACYLKISIAARRSTSSLHAC